MYDEKLDTIDRLCSASQVSWCWKIIEPVDAKVCSTQMVPTVLGW